MITRFTSSSSRRKFSTGPSPSQFSRLPRLFSPAVRTKYTNYLFYTVALFSILTVSSIGMSSNTLPCPARTGDGRVGLDGQPWQDDGIVKDTSSNGATKKKRNRRWLEDPFVQKPIPQQNSLPRARAREDRILRAKSTSSSATTASSSVAAKRSRRTEEIKATERAEEKESTWSDWIRTRF